MWLPKEEYFAKLKDPRWQKKRLEILERDNFACQVCGDNESTLHVHHKFYLRDRELWEYNNGCFITLCENCHAYETSRMPEVIYELNAVIKFYFMADNVEIISRAIHKFDISNDGHFKACVIEYALTEMKDLIVEKYKQYIKSAGVKNGEA